jgi:hypothetical protein
VSTLAGAGSGGGGAANGFVDGVGPGAFFFYPVDTAMSPDGGTLYVLDSGNHIIRTVALPPRSPSREPWQAARVVVTVALLTGWGRRRSFPTRKPSR